MIVSQKRTAKTASLPAPVGGWNARDSLADMDSSDAVILINWFPSTSELVLRKGYTEYADTIPSPVETLMTYTGSTANELFAIAGNSVYDCTNGGAVGAAVLSGLSNARWEYVNYTTTGGSYLYMVNGVNAPYTYDGTTWSNPTITGVTPSTLDNINMHKGRVWFTDATTLKAYYLAQALFLVRYLR